MGRKQETKIHWGGGTRTYNKKGALRKTLQGFPCCCSGYRAELITARGDLTTDLKKVTCSNCKKLLEKGDDNNKSEGEQKPVSKTDMEDSREN